MHIGLNEFPSTRSSQSIVTTGSRNAQLLNGDSTVPSQGGGLPREQEFPGP